MNLIAPEFLQPLVMIPEEAGFRVFLTKLLPYISVDSVSGDPMELILKPRMAPFGSGRGVPDEGVLAFFTLSGLI